MELCRLSLQQSRHAVLLELIKCLPECQQHVILLRYPLDSFSQSYSDQQIGLMLEISATWVKTLREKAFTNLRREVEELNLR